MDDFEARGLARHRATARSLHRNSLSNRPRPFQNSGEGFWNTVGIQPGEYTFGRTDIRAETLRKY